VAVRRLARAVIRGLRACQDPVALPEGLGGTYVFADEAGRPAALVKPVDEEPLGPNNGKGWSGRALGEPGLKPTVRVGEAAMREVAAFLLDHGGYARVPPTVLVRVQHPIFHVAGRPPPVGSQGQGRAGEAATPDHALFGGGSGGLLASVPSDASTHTSALPGDGGGGGGRGSQQHLTPPTVAGFGAPPPPLPPPASRRPASALPTARSGSLPDPATCSPRRGGGAPPRSPVRGGLAGTGAATGGLSAALGRVLTGPGDLPAIAAAAAAGAGHAASTFTAPTPSPQPLPIKLASMAKYVAHDGDASEFGPARFSRAGVVAVGILDLRLCNTDRHAGNILVRRPRDPGEQHARGSAGGDGGAPGRPSAEGDGPATPSRPPGQALASSTPAALGTAAPMDLVPIDHGFCLPEALEPLLLDWLFWPQAAVPFDADAKAYIASLDAGADVALLRRELPSMHVGCLRVLTIGTTLLQRCTAADLTLSEIGAIASRQSIGIDEEPSELERLCWSARAAARALAARGGAGKEEESGDGGAGGSAGDDDDLSLSPQATRGLSGGGSDSAAGDPGPGPSGAAKAAAPPATAMATTPAPPDLLVFAMDAMDLGASPDSSPPPPGWGSGLLAGNNGGGHVEASPAGPPSLAMAVSAPTPARAAAAAGGGVGAGAGAAAAASPALIPPPPPLQPLPTRPPALHRRSRRELGRDAAPYPPPLAPASAPGAAVPLADLTPIQWEAFMDAFERGIAAALADGRWRAPAGDPGFGGQSCAF